MFVCMELSEEGRQQLACSKNTPMRLIYNCLSSLDVRVDNIEVVSDNPKSPLRSATAASYLRKKLLHKVTERRVPEKISRWNSVADVHPLQLEKEKSPGSLIIPVRRLSDNRYEYQYPEDVDDRDDNDDDDDDDDTQLLGHRKKRRSLEDKDGVQTSASIIEETDDSFPRKPTRRPSDPDASQDPNVSVNSGTRAHRRLSTRLSMKAVNDSYTTNCLLRVLWQLQEEDRLDGDEECSNMANGSTPTSEPPQFDSLDIPCRQPCRRRSSGISLEALSLVSEKDCLPVAEQSKLSSANSTSAQQATHENDSLCKMDRPHLSAQPTSLLRQLNLSYVSPCQVTLPGKVTLANDLGHILSSMDIQERDTHTSKV